MAFLYPDDSVFLDLPSIPLWKKQGEFVRFLVNEYFTKPCSVVEDENRALRSGLMSDIPYRDCILSDEIAEIMGNICEKIRLLDQKHVQDKPPFTLLEKPLLVPAVLGALLQRYLFEEFGTFVSPTCFDSWAARALGFDIRISRVWLNADLRVQQALQHSSAKHLVNSRDACETGVHAIKMQALDRGPLSSLWNAVSTSLSTALMTGPLPTESSSAGFYKAMQDAIALRRKINRQQNSKAVTHFSANYVLYAVPEPELCGCTIYHSCFQEINSLFGSAVSSRKRKEATSSLMREFFIGCLNIFSFNSYTLKRSEGVHKTLDAIVEIAEGERALRQRDLRQGYSMRSVAYLQRTAVLSCDEISAGIDVLLKTSGTLRSDQRSCKRAFSDMSDSAIDLRRLFSFAKSGKCEAKRAADCCDPAARGLVTLENCEDWVDYTEETLISLSDGDEDSLKYILTEKERIAKQLVYGQLYGSGNVEAPR